LGHRGVDQRTVTEQFILSRDNENTTIPGVTVDPKERTNVCADHPEVVEELTAILRRFVQRGRSTPGPVQANTGGTSWPGLPWHAAGRAK